MASKSDRLRVLRENNPEIPIPSFIQVKNKADMTGIDTLANTNDTIIKNLAKQQISYPLIIRSDDPEELGITFPGAYHSRTANALTLKQAISTVHNRIAWEEEQLDWYCFTRRIPIPSKPHCLFAQNFIDSRLRGLMTPDPHNFNTYYLDIENRTNDFRTDKMGWRISNGDFSEVRKDIPNGFLKENVGQDLSRLIEELEQAFHNIKQTLHNVCESYQTEITLLPYAFVQQRPFRKYDIGRSNEETELIALGLMEETELPIYDMSIMQWRGQSQKSFKALLHRVMIKHKQRSEEGPYIGVYRAITAGDAPLNDYCPILACVPSNYLPDLAIFCETYRSEGIHPWQAHNSFSFLERGTNTLLTTEDITGRKAIYSNDGTPQLRVLE